MYKMEDQKFVALQNTFEDYNHETGLVEKVFVELIEFIDGANDAEVLVKVGDISEFIKRSFDKLEKMCQSGLSMKEEIYISNKLTPYIVDTKQSLAIVNLFEMVPPTKEIFNVFDLKFLKEKMTFAQSQGKRASVGDKIREDKLLEYPVSTAEE